LPLVETIFRDGSFEDFVLDVAPDAAFDDRHSGNSMEKDACV
jgi:hypothetical protein